MKYVYASRMGHVEKLVQALSLDALKIVDGTEVVTEDFTLFTYTDGNGIVPPVVVTFLEKNGANLKAVVASGNSTRHPNTFCFAGKLIAEAYGVPVLANVEDEGTAEDVAAIKAKL